MSIEESYCGDKIPAIGDYYQLNIYVHISIPICSAGMILNLLNVLVFTRRTMNSPPNLILAHLAFVDFSFLLSYITRFWITFIQPKSGFDQKQSYALTIVKEYSDIFVITIQFISILLTVQLAAWRYIAIVHPLRERQWCSKKNTRNVVIAAYVLGCVYYATDHFSFDIKAQDKHGKTYYTTTMGQHPIMYSIRVIFYGLVIKSLPSLVLTGLTSRIVVTLLGRKVNREQLSASSSTRSDMKNVEMRKQTNRSTAILLAVVALFFVAEFPRGILWLLKTINGDKWRSCYYSLRATFQTITQINASITFVVYYTLSQQFRTTFKSLFSRTPRTTSHRTRTPLPLCDTKEPSSGRKTSEV